MSLAEDKQSTRAPLRGRGAAVRVGGRQMAMPRAEVKQACTLLMYIISTIIRIYVYAHAQVNS